MQGYLVKLLYVSLFSFSFLFIITPQRHLSVIIKTVVDGDTVKLIGGESIRLAHIDAPEIAQESIDGVKVGEDSRSALEEYIQNKHVKIEIQGRDFYNRYLGILYVDNENINQKLVKEGYAVSYKDKYLFDEYVARKKRVGIWATKGFYYPKVHRKYKKKYKLKSTRRYLGQR